MPSHLEDLIAKAVNPNGLKPDAYLTLPRSYGVYEIKDVSLQEKIYRRGNYPVRLFELQREFPDCTLKYLFLSKEEAIEVASILNAKKKNHKSVVRKSVRLSNLDSDGSKNNIIHPSKALVELFKRKPYQGVAPERSRFLFIGLDANYNANIEDDVIFPKILEYHEDGVEFWRAHGEHHPFLHPDYQGDGKQYHQNFRRIGFKPDHASLVSFVELFHLPTVGRNKLSVSDLNPVHFMMLNQAILEGEAKYIFISPTVASLMRASGAFTWLPNKPGEKNDVLPVLFKNGGKTVYSLMHFSSYGKSGVKLSLQLDEIKKLVTQC